MSSARDFDPEKRFPSAVLNNDIGLNRWRTAVRLTEEAEFLPVPDATSTDCRSLSSVGPYILVDTDEDAPASL